MSRNYIHAICEIISVHMLHTFSVYIEGPPYIPSQPISKDLSRNERVFRKSKILLYLWAPMKEPEKILKCVADDQDQVNSCHSIPH